MRAPQLVDLEFDFAPVGRRLESTINAAADRVIQAQGQSERRVLDGVNVSESRLRGEIHQGVNWLGNEIRAGSGPRIPVIYPPAAGITATSRGAALMADGHGGGGGHGGNSFFVLAIAAAVGVFFLFLIIGAINAMMGNTVRTTTVIERHIEAPSMKAEGSCPTEKLKGYNADGVPEYTLNFDC